MPRGFVTMPDRHPVGDGRDRLPRPPLRWPGPSHNRLPGGRHNRRRRLRGLPPATGPSWIGGQTSGFVRLVLRVIGVVHEGGAGRLRVPHQCVGSSGKGPAHRLRRLHGWSNSQHAAGGHEPAHAAVATKYIADAAGRRVGVEDVNIDAAVVGPFPPAR